MMAAKVTARIVTAAVATTVTAAMAATAMAATTTAAAALAPRSVSYWRQRQRNTHCHYRGELWFHGALPCRPPNGPLARRLHSEPGIGMRQYLEPNWQRSSA
jgi:hypothetical protein